MTSNNGDKELVPLNGRHLPHGFSDDVVARALGLIQSTRSMAEAQSLLDKEMRAAGAELVPDYKTLWMWARQHQDVIQTIQTDRKRDMVAVAGDVAMAWGQRSLEAAEAKDEKGRYEVSHRESAYHYGIAMQRRTDWERAGQASTVIPIQLNVSSGGQAAANPWSKDKD